MSIPAIKTAQFTNYLKIAVIAAVLILLAFSFASTYAMPLISFITVIALAYIVAQFSLVGVFQLMVLVIPLATNQKIFDADLTLFIPSEPIEAIIALAFAFKLLFGYKISNRLLKHPIFIVIMAGLAIQFTAILSSAMPIVSAKAMFLKSCYITVFFILCADLYHKKLMSHFTLLKTYTFSILIVGTIIFIKHLDYGLSKDISGSVTEPFYADHTIYSACLAFILPLPLLSFFNSKILQINFYQKFWIACITAVLLCFFFFTYCRAGWISVVISIFMVMAVFMGLKFKGFVLLIMAGLSMIYLFQNDIADSLKQNKADSNAKNASLEQQTKSVTNITSDQSNAERLNRWSCAWRMFLDKPWLGYGPGTYQFEYLSYQKKSEMTRISVTSPYNIKKGKGGTAHSEYLLLLAESGIFSFVINITSILCIIYYALQVFHLAENPQTKVKIMIVFFGFCSYVLHSFFNNFLDTDKAAMLYYISVAAIMIEAIKIKSLVHQQTT
jgi:O-antigen ligase